MPTREWELGLGTWGTVCGDQIDPVCVCVCELVSGKEDTHLRWRGWGATGDDEAKHWQEECSSLPRACLGTGHQVTASNYNGQGILLHWSGAGILGQLQHRKITPTSLPHLFPRTSMFAWMMGEKLHSMNEETCLGQPSPVASTGMSSYLSKLIPVLQLANNSLQNHTHLCHDNSNHNSHLSTRSFGSNCLFHSSAVIPPYPLSSDLRPAP